MQLIRVGAAVLNQTPLDWGGNRDRIAAAIAGARDRGVTLLCLPELSIPGYNCEDAFLSRGVQETSFEILEELVPATSGMVVSFGLPVRYRNALFNTACLVADGNILGFVAKRHLAGDGIYYEPRWFKPWPAERRGEISRGRARHPIGDLYFACGGVRIGFEICEDAWVAKRPGAELALRAVDVILNPSASHFAFGKLAVRNRQVIEGSRAFGVSYVYSNLLGSETGNAIYDGGALIASGGQLLAQGPRFRFAETLVTSAVVDLETTRTLRAATGSYEPLLGDEKRLVEAPFRWPEIEPEVARPAPEPWEEGPHVKEEEFTRAVTLGLFDYLRKSGSEGFVVSLSGGADSSATSCLVALMADRTVAELGLAGFKERLPHAGRVQGAPDVAALKAVLLTCLYQSTRNSTPTTLEAARKVARAIGARFVELDVDPLVEGYVRMVSEALGRRLTWEDDDIALQNIQARVRAPSAWLVANLHHALLLAASNRSEAAVGYTTMDGDTAGGLSPIAGIDKAFLRRWLRWLETTGPAGLQPIPALAAVNALEPTAELRPPGAGQTDEADLMPYELLDAIERAAIRDKKSPLEVYRLMRARHPEYDARRLGAWVERFFHLWCRNQWKRERYAPSFHLDDQNLDPKSWCRFPILSGGFERELAELRDYVERRGRAVRSARGPGGR